MVPPPIPDVAVPAEEVLVQLEELAVAVATEAGRLIVGERPVELAVATTKSSSTDVVTEMDQRSQDLLHRRLSAARPDDAFLGEEEGGRLGSSGVTWVVDPIDGTVNYLYDIPAYAVSVAAVVGDPSVVGGWTPVAGCVVNPVSGEVFHARRGGGARRRRGRLARTSARVSSAGDPGMALVGTGFGYVAAKRAWQASVLASVLPRVRDVRRMGSAALDLCHVADGTLDGYYEHGLNAWDMAAGWLVVTEAGGVVTGPGGGAPSSGLVLAAGAGLHSGLAALVDDAVSAAGDPPDPS